MIAQAEETISRVKPATRNAFELIYNLLVDDIGCVVSARPDYVTFSLGSEMVAAAHPQTQSIDLVLALPFDPSKKQLFDAIDYKWRSLPAGITITTAASAKVAMKFVQDAADRVRSGETLTIEGDAYARPTGTYQPAFKKFKKK